MEDMSEDLGMTTSPGLLLEDCFDAAFLLLEVAGGYVSHSFQAAIHRLLIAHDCINTHVIASSEAEASSGTLTSRPSFEAWNALGAAYVAAAVTGGPARH